MKKIKIRNIIMGDEMKKIGFIFLMLVMMFGTVYSQIPTPAEYLNVKISEDGESCIIAGFSDEGKKMQITDLVIPDEIEGFPVVTVYGFEDWSDTIKVQCQNCRKREEEGQ